MAKTAKEPSPQTLRQVSAGGVVFRQSGARIEFIIIQVLPQKRWQLPKGIIDEGETPERAAIREVREEAGVVAEIISAIETVEYWYLAPLKEERVRFHKFVHFYLMQYESGSVDDHDFEVAEARWVSPEEASSMLAFKSERDALKKAIEMITAQ